MVTSRLYSSAFEASKSFERRFLLMIINSCFAQMRDETVFVATFSYRKKDRIRVCVLFYR